MAQYGLPPPMGGFPPMASPPMQPQTGMQQPFSPLLNNIPPTMMAQPQYIMEDYVVMEKRTLAMTFPVTYKRIKTEPVLRKISIPRPMVENRVVSKTVSKVIQVEESYEVESAVTELKTFFTGADANSDGQLSFAEWQTANRMKGYDTATMRQMFSERDADGDGQVSMAEMMSYKGAGGFIPGQYSNPVSSGLVQMPGRSPISSLYGSQMSSMYASQSGTGQSMPAVMFQNPDRNTPYMGQGMPIGAQFARGY